jgi:hypothetical protein
MYLQRGRGVSIAEEWAKVKSCVRSVRHFIVGEGKKEKNIVGRIPYFACSS